jgi:hypothetical protein
LLAAGHHVAGTAEHLAEPAEDLSELGHVEIGPAAKVGVERALLIPRVFLGLIAVGVVPAGEAERQVSHTLNGTHQLSVVWLAGHAESEPLHWSP